MTLASHMAIGSAIGVLTKNPVLGFAAGFVSHHVLDILPHIDQGTIGADAETIFENKIALSWVFSDIVFGGSLFLIAFFRADFSMVVFWSMLGAVLTDLIDNMPFYVKKIRKIVPFNYLHRFHEKFHFTIMDPKLFWLGALTQFVVIFSSAFIIFLMTS